MRLRANNLDKWATKPKSPIKRLRRTEWLFRSTKDVGISICVLCFTHVAILMASQLPDTPCGFYMHSLRAWRGVTDIWKQYVFDMSLNPIPVALPEHDTAVQDASDALIDDLNDRFTHADDVVPIPEELTRCYVDLSIDNVLPEE